LGESARKLMNLKKKIIITVNMTIYCHKRAQAIRQNQISTTRAFMNMIQCHPNCRDFSRKDTRWFRQALRSRRTTCKAHPWVYESKQSYWDLQQLNYDVKLMWIPSHVGLSGNKVTDGLARQAVEIGTVQMTVANDHRILARQAMI
jgi:ribonuclease HI